MSQHPSIIAASAPSSLLPGVPPKRTPGWFVTFGDLLTLLLCFFITVSSRAAYPPPQSVEKPPQAQDGRSESRESGISIAHPIGQGPADGMALSADGYTLKTSLGALEVLPDTVRELAANVANLKGYVVSRVRVRVCSGSLLALGLEDEPGTRAVELRRQFADAGVSAPEWRYQLQGECLPGPDGEEKVAEIEVQVRHG